MNEQPPQWQPPQYPQNPQNMGHDAAKSFLGGFAGCLGVGLAIIFVLFVIILLVSAAGHH